jgi:ankyrin repeat protein
MYAVLYLDTANLAKLLELGADPNKHNDDNATALMWAARDFKKTRLLVAHGADVNARSDDHRTPLMIAARRPGAVKTVKFLLDKGANPNPTTVPVGESSPLLEALTAGDEAIVRLLIQRGADAKATADQGLVMAVFSRCERGLELLAEKITDTNVYTAALGQIAYLGDTKAIRLMLDHGADVNAADPTGRTPLMYAAVSDLLPVDSVKLLLERGADVNAIDRHKRSGDSGYTALDIAKENGNTPIVELLLKAGAHAGEATPPALNPRRHKTIRDAVQGCLPLLQHADANFAKNTSCFSCHDNSMEAMTIGLARKRGFRIDEATASAQVRFNVEALEAFRDKMHQGFMVPEADYYSDFVLGFALVGLHAENYTPDLNTDAAALLIQSRQKANGEWAYPRADSRPPICLDYVGQTAMAMRALQFYAPKTAKGACDRSIRLAASWLAHARPLTPADRTWRLIGLAWAGMDQAATQEALREVLATQRSDGGWSDLASLTGASTAYATGMILVALHVAGVPVSDLAYKRGVDFLLATQQEDGSWFNKTRALGFQPYFDGSFPHGYDQFISAAGTSWAAMALTLTLPETESLTASTQR